MLEIPYRRGRREEIVLHPETREEYEAAIVSACNLIVTQEQCDEWGVHPEVANVDAEEAMDLLFGSDEQYWEAVLLRDGDGDATVEADSGLEEAPAPASSVEAAAAE